MKRAYKIIIFFIIIFLLGVFSFAGYINYSLNKSDEIKAADVNSPSKKGSSKVVYRFR